MKLPKKILSSALLCVAPALAQAADVVLGVPNWPTGAATSYILKEVMEENYGLDVEMQTGTNAVIFEGMDRGSIDVHPEVWLPNQQSLHDKYVNERGTVVQGKHGIPAVQGICVTRETSEKYGITSIYDLTNPDVAALFDRDGDGMGELRIEAAAASGPVEMVRAKSYGYDQTFELQELDEALHIARLDASVKSKTPYVFFCYKPKHVFAMYDLVMLEEPEHNPDTWHVLQPAEDPNWLENSNADSAWPAAYLYLHYAKSLEERQPLVASMLQNFQLTSDQMTQISYELVVDKMDMESFAKKWVGEHQDVVSLWLNQ